MTDGQFREVVFLLPFSSIERHSIGVGTNNTEPDRRNRGPRRGREQPRLEQLLPKVSLRAQDLSPNRARYKRRHRISSPRLYEGGLTFTREVVQRPQLAVLQSFSRALHEATLTTIAPSQPVGKPDEASNNWD